MLFWSFLQRRGVVGMMGAIALVTAGSGGAIAQASPTYQPGTISSSSELNDTLSTKDIPTGQGGFARDYKISLTAGDRVEITASSDSFDTVLMLIADDGSSVAENDDGPDGGTNSLIFTSIQNTGEYVVRVQTFGKAVGGPFKLKVTRLQPIQ
ncbi:MAG: PPC domain-containing protein [Limnothrix sp.]|uniref:PPC domain-containing protein n=1 Tax=unclassified Limnothrix TaxID=2632864 RepID=UPI00081E1E7D|nr:MULTISPECIES: PPC domain-containing protein [unclassified Limnothrix]MEB3118808.1 PPC domain-containing protein [Limnothrix sp.]OCQ93565.1 peptidase [Limnothrix sp. P13C2]